MDLIFIVFSFIDSNLRLFLQPCDTIGIYFLIGLSKSALNALIPNEVEKQCNLGYTPVTLMLANSD